MGGKVSVGALEREGVRLPTGSRLRVHRGSRGTSIGCLRTSMRGRGVIRRRARPVSAGVKKPVPQEIWVREGGVYMAVSWSFSSEARDDLDQPAALE